MTITPEDVLAKGTKVRVGNDYGEIVSHRIVNAVPSGKIVVHEIRFTHKRVRNYGRNYSLKEISTPVTRSVNYSFIEVL